MMAQAGRETGVCDAPMPAWMPWKQSWFWDPALDDPWGCPGSPEMFTPPHNGVRHRTGFSMCQDRSLNPPHSLHSSCFWATPGTAQGQSGRAGNGFRVSCCKAGAQPLEHIPCFPLEIFSGLFLGLIWQCSQLTPGSVLSDCS